MGHPGKASGQPVYKLLSGRARERLPASANGWYGGARTPADYAATARRVVAKGYSAMKFDRPCGVVCGDPLRMGFTLMGS